jgi:hypothetical protein
VRKSYSPLLALALLANAPVACGGAHNDNAPPSAVIIDDMAIGPGRNQLQYIGPWEHVRNRRDGRYAGTSSRSFQVGDAAIITFTGSHVRVFGVNGPNGGLANVAIDGRSLGTASFKARYKIVRAIDFQSPKLPSGMHTLALVVSGSPMHERAYVNLDAIEVLP